MKRLFKFTCALSLAVSGLAISAPLLADVANAACNCVQYDDYHNTEDTKENSIKTHVSTEINAMTLAIIEALRLGTGQLTGNLREQTTADSNMADVLDDRAVVGRVEQERINAIKDAASGASTCSVLTGAAAGGSLNGEIESDRIILNDEMAKWNLGLEGPSSEGESVAMNARLQLHCSDFSTDADVESGLCSAASANEQYAHADVEASKSLLFADAGSGSRTLDAKRLKAARGFIINAFNPEPLARMSTNAASTPAGRETAADRSIVQSRVSISTNAANSYLSKVAPRDNLTGPVTSLSQDVIGYSGNSFPNGASWFDWMEVQSRQWHMNPSWKVKMDTNSPGQAVKDMAGILAFSVFQNWESYKVQNDISMSLASINAILVEMNERDKSRQ